MAVITINGSIVVEDNASGNGDFPGTIPVRQADGKFVDTDAGSVIVTDVIIAEGNEVVTVASIA